MQCPNLEIDFSWFYVNLEQAMASCERDRFAEIDAHLKNIYRDFSLKSYPVQELAEAYKAKDAEAIELLGKEVADLLKEKEFKLIWVKCNESGNHSLDNTPEKSHNLLKERIEKVKAERKKLNFE